MNAALKRTAEDADSEGKKQKKVYLSRGQKKELEVSPAPELPAKKPSSAGENGNFSAALNAQVPSELPGSDGTAVSVSVSTSIAPKVIPPPLEIDRKLRSFLQPIRLFGESDADRFLRLRAVELLEGRAVVAPTVVVAPVSSNEDRGSVEITPELIAQPEKLNAVVYHHLKRLHREWHAFLQERPESVRKSVPGKAVTVLCEQTGSLLAPFYTQLRKKTADKQVVKAVAEILRYAQLRRYQDANDAYLRLSIGNAAWPIGVTMVGIHARSAREKINSNQTAHVLNDEVSRKYIQSIKRLLTFAQTKYPPDDRSQLMG